jgi:tRNA G18 (ribose-2'-O)-methylase SpoU
VTPFAVTDPADPRVGDYIGLTDAARRMQHEPAAGFFLAEGEKVVRRAADAGYPVRSLLVSEQRYPELERRLRELDCPAYVASYDVLRALTGFHVHRGVLASFGRLPLPPAEQVLRAARRVLVMEAVTNHTNLGAVFRSAAALGMDAVLLSATSCDPLYRRCVRVSMGQVFAVPYAYLPAWPDGLGDLRRDGFRLLALTPDPAAVRLDELQVGADDKVALLFGAEGPGLSDQALQAADERVRIPMSAGVDSLNVAAAAAIGCWVLGHRR